MASKVYLTFKTEFFQEPLGGAHADPAWTSQQIKLVIKEAMEVSDLHIFAYRRGKKKNQTMTSLHISAIYSCPGLSL